MENKNAFEEHAKAMYSGLYSNPKIHPETEKNMPNIPPLADTIKEDYTSAPPKRVALDLESMPKKSRLTLAVIILCLVGLLFLGYLWRENKSPREVLTFPVDEIVSKTVSGVVSGIYELLPERVIQEKVKIVRIKDNGQKAALAKVKAWKELNDKMIQEFYNNKKLTGIRKMCVTYGDSKRCVEHDSIDIRPELPDYLRRTP